MVAIADVDITSLSVEISAESQGAELNIDKLATAISKLRTKGSIGKVCSSLDKLSSSISALKQSSAGISGLDKVTNFLNGISSVNTTAGVRGVNSVVNAIKKIPNAVSALNGVDFYSMSGSITQLTNALAPLSILDISGLKSLGSAFKAIGTVPDLTDKLKAADLDSFADSCQKISTALTPLASQLETVGNAFAKLPPQLSKVVTQSNRVTAANERQKKSYMSLSSQMNSFMRNMAKLVSLKAIATYLGNAAEKFNSYYEAANLFGVSMKGLTGEASTFINKMETLLDIDPTEAMNNMATIQSLTTSFGLASDKAYVLSKNLTQLGYDLASLKNIPVAESFTKIQAAISGELEPIRRLGVDISNARLQQELLNLGYSQSVSTLSQADKAVLRYIAIMKQTTDAQGDFARTLSSPANMIRILQAQLNSLARAVGSLLYPALKSILPPLIAAVELVKELVTGIASLMGVKVEFPDFSSASDAVGGVTDAMDNTTKATGKAAKAFKNYIMGFDELNVIQKDNGSSGGSGSGGGAAGNLLGDVDLSGYDMFKRYNEEFAKQIDGIKQKIKAMLPLMATVAAALAAWKLTNLITDIVDAIHKMNALKSIVLGLGVFTVGIVLEITGIKDAIESGVNGKNFAEIVLGALIGTTGVAILGKGIAQFIVTGFGNTAVGAAIKAAGGSTAGAIIGAAVGGVVTGIPMFVIGVYDAVKKGLNALNGILIPLGSTMAGAGIGAIIGSLGGPITAGIGAIIGLIVGGLTDAGIAIYQNWDKITESLDKASESLKNWFVSVGEWWNKKWQGFSTNFQKSWDSLPGFVQHPIQALDQASAGLKQWFVSVGVWWNEKWKGFKTNWDKSWNSLVDTLKELPQKFLNYGKNIVQGLIDGINKGIESAKKSVSGLAKAILDKFTTDTGIHSPSKVFKGYGGYIVEGLANGISAAKDLAVNAIQSVSDAVKTIGSQLADENYGLRNGSISLSVDASGKSMMETANALKRTMRTTNDSFGGWFKKMKTDLGDFTDGINAVTKAGKDISNGFKSSVDALTAASKSILNTHDGFVSAVSDIRSFVKKSVAEIENEYQYNGFFSAAGLAIKKAFEGVYLVFNKVSSAIKNVSDTIDSVKNVITTFNALKTKVGEVIDQVPALKQAYGGLKSFFSDLFDKDSGIGKFFSDSWDSILKGTKGFLNQLGIDFSSAWKSLGIEKGVRELTGLIYSAFNSNWKGILDSGLNFLKQLGSNLGIGSGNGSGGSSGSGSGSGSSGGAGKWANAAINTGLAIIKGFAGDIPGAIFSAFSAVGNVAGDIFGWVGDAFGGVVNWVGDAIGGVVDFFKGIFGFASGGFPDAGQLFIAREAGAEMVGSLGGHTAVANNDQIVEGIREGVEAAMERQNQLLRRQNELLQALLEKEGSAEVNVSSFYQAVNRTNQRNGKTIIPVGT